MPILFQIVVEGNTGATGTMAESLGEVVLDNGWQSFIAYGRFRRPSKSQQIRIGSNISIIVHGIISRLLDRHGLGSREATKRLIKKIKVIKPDIIHLHHLHGYYINIQILFKFLSSENIPVVWTFHDCWSMTGHCCHFDYVGCGRWQTECHICPQKKVYPKSFFIDRSSRNHQLKKHLFTSVNKMMIISVSYWLDMIVNKSFLKNVRHTVIYNGIDISIFKPSNNKAKIRLHYGIKGFYIILGVAGLWSLRKGLQDFFELSKFLMPDEIIVLVGLNDSQQRQLPKNIIGLPKTENKNELAELYSASDVFMNLSVEETFGLTTAEALACGTPAIVYNSTACPEVIDEETGYVVQIQDFRGLINALACIKSNGKTFYSERCRNRALKYFNKEDQLVNYLKLYQSLL